MKEWKGNSNSLRAAISVKSPNSTNEREQDDFYATDPKALEELLAHSSYYLHNIFCNRPVIWEPACGNGNLALVLNKHDLPTYASDLKNRGYGMYDMDFLQNNNFIDAQIILTNPPYSLATEFIEHALDILPDGGLYIALMNITYLAGQKRYQRVYSKGSLREIYVFSKRVECWKNGEKPKDKCGSIANYAWYVFQKGYNGQPTLYWL